MWFIICIIVLLVLFISYQNRSIKIRTGGVNGGNKKTKLKKQYHCVEIHTEGEHCRAVEQLGTQRFLSGSAPTLPLFDCDVIDCGCYFIHHKDRRVSERRDDFSLEHKLYDQTAKEDHPKRKTRGRRSTDN